MKNTFASLCGRDTPALGFYISESDLSVAEMVGYAGFDYMRVDNEHTLMNPSKLQNIIRICDSFNIPVLVRVPDYDDFTKILDFGATGILVPGIFSVEQAKECVRLCKYAPIGQRGMGTSSRHTRYGLENFQEFMKASYKNTSLCMQIEDEKGVRDIEQILSIEGIDLVAVGENDLAQSMGYAGQPSHPEVTKAKHKVLETALKLGVQPVVSATNPKAYKEYKAMGVKLLTTCFDLPFISKSLGDHIAQFRQLESTTSPAESRHE
jgi:2-keto-3-deoxy-L-rhamnonate aldolase RhmA